MCATVPAEAKAILGDRFCAGGVLGTGNSFHVDSFAVRIGACVQDGGCIQRVPRGQDHAHLGGRQAWVRKRKPGVFRTLLLRGGKPCYRSRKIRRVSLFPRVRSLRVRNKKGGLSWWCLAGGGTPSASLCAFWQAVARNVLQISRGAYINAYPPTHPPYRSRCCVSV